MITEHLSFNKVFFIHRLDITENMFRNKVYCLLYILKC